MPENQKNNRAEQSATAEGQEMLILPGENDINRPDFNACNYASLAAQSRLFAQMSGGKRALS